MSEKEFVNRRQLKNFLLYPRYQIKYVLGQVITALVLVFLNLFVFYYFVFKHYDEFLRLSLIEENIKLLLYQQLNVVVVFLALFSVFFLFVTALVGIVYSHQTVGSIYNIHKTIKVISEGDRSARIKLRPNDEFQDLADSFNKMMDSL